MSDQLYEMLSEWERLAKAVLRLPRGQINSRAAIEHREGNNLFESFATPAFALEFISAVRFALAPRVGYLPPRPSKMLCDVVPVPHHYCSYAATQAYCEEVESQLRASQAEVERLRGELDSFREELESTDGWLMKHPRPHPWQADQAAKEYTYLLENRVRWLNTGIACSRSDRTNFKQRAESAELRLTTCREDERKRCLEAVRVLSKYQPITWRLQGYKNAIEDANQAIIEIGKGEKLKQLTCAYRFAGCSTGAGRMRGAT